MKKFFFALFAIVAVAVSGCQTAKTGGGGSVSAPAVIGGKATVAETPAAGGKSGLDRLWENVKIAGEIRDGMVCVRATVLGVGPEVCVGLVPRLNLGGSETPSDSEQAAIDESVKAAVAGINAKP